VWRAGSSGGGWLPAAARYRGPRSGEPVGRASQADRLHELFGVSAEVQHAALADTGVVAGCLFGNLALELSSTEATVRARLQEIFDVQVRMIEDTLAGDGPAGDRDESLHHLATSLVAQLEGLVLFAKRRGDPSELAAHWDTIARMLPPTPTEAGSLPSPAARTRPMNAADATAG
jgi:TetR/AcrR family transcriptional repressor of nem operon